ncbi:nSTAND3 domain-containing NTPase [Acinetobacter soli]|uniref:nSTAND3 domain-containing NTPase n=1 Tax=Acinetobacter soli TaxID=487316 RepID=UPI00370BD4F0
MSNLDNLSPLDFESLCRDIASQKMGLSFSTFGPGPDGGIDGRHSTAEGDIILQCKHYLHTPFSGLKKSMLQEKVKLDILKPKKYLFFTSQSLTPKKTVQLEQILSPYVLSSNDLFGKEDIDSALRDFPDIEKKHMKLWLSSSAVLERILYSGLEAYTDATKEEILEELAVYVLNPSLYNAIDQLEREKVLVISGQPGVGKTTLAKMVSYHYLKEDWSFVSINSLEDGFSKLNNDQKTVFFFDDFLGRIELDRQTLLQKDNALALFVKKVVKAPNARFILTTRAHIFEEAKLISDRVDSTKFHLAKYLLDVGQYTRKVRAEIFFNHLFSSNLGPQYIEHLIEGDSLSTIIDHQNYNPRVIAFVSSELNKNISPTDYLNYILDTLNNPEMIWSKPFKSLNPSSKHLLITLFFQKTFLGVSIEELRNQFSKLHKHICDFYGHPISPDDFNSSLKSLESGFISISSGNVDFVNPSIQDFLKSYLNNKEFLGLLSTVAIKNKWAKSLWEHMKKVFNNPEDLQDCAYSFAEFIDKIGSSPTQSKRRSTSLIQGYVIKFTDMSLSERVEFLFDLWAFSNHMGFLEQALKLLESSNLDIDKGRDGQYLPKLHYWVNENIEESFLISNQLLKAIEEKIKEILEQGVHIADLNMIIENTDLYIPNRKELGFQKFIDYWVDFELFSTSESIAGLDSESDLSDHLIFLDELSKLTNRNAEDAKNTVYDRISELDDIEEVSSESISQPFKKSENEIVFSDADIKSLFGHLLA